MEGVSLLEFYLGAAAYAAAAILYFLDLAAVRGAQRSAPFAPWLLGVGAALHLAHVVTSSLVLKRCSLYALDSALSLASVVVVIAYLAVRQGRLQALGAFVAPIALTFLIGSEFVSAGEPTQPQQSLLAVHVAANLGGLGVFLVAGAMGVLYVVQERRLKGKMVRRTAARLPPLEVLDALSHRLVLIGFPLLTLGIVTGAMFAARLATGDTLEIARATFAYLAWCVVAGALVLRSVAGWRGRRAAWAAMIGAACIVLVVVGYVIQPALGGAT